MTRRHAFTIAAQGLGGLAGAAIILPAVGFAVAPIFHRGKERWEAVGPLADFTADTYRQVVFTETEGIGDAGKTTAYVRKGSSRSRRGPEGLHRHLQPLRPPRLPGALRRGGRQLHLPLPRRRLRLRRQGDRRPAGAPARPVPDPHPRRPGRARPALQRHLAARAGPRPRPRASSPAASGSTSIRRVRPPSRRLSNSIKLSPKLDRMIPAPLRKPAKPGANGAKGDAPADLKTLAAGAAGRHVEARRPAPRRRRSTSLAWVDQRTAAIRLPHRDALPQGAEGDQLVLHARLGDPLRLHRAGGHRGLPGDVLHALDDPGLRLDRPHQQRRLPRRLRARHAQVGLERDGHPDLPAHGAHLLLRRLQVPARAQLGDRRRAADPDHDDGLHRLPAALRPALLLGLGRRHQHQRHRPGRRPLPERLPARRPRAGRDDALALLRDPHAAAARRDHRPDRRPPLPGRQARHDGAALAEGREAEERAAGSAGSTPASAATERRPTS